MACIFCQIVAKEAPSTCLHEDEHCIVINDLYPQAPVHQLVISKKHIPSMADMAEEDVGLLGHMMWVAKCMAEKAGIHETGYRLENACGPDGGQEVFHWHLHVLGGKKLRP